MTKEIKQMNHYLRLSACCLFALILGCQQDAGMNQAGTAVQRVGDAAALKTKMDTENTLVIHALDAEHYAKGHVPGAVNVDYEKMMPEMLPTDKAQALVFYCAGPMCPVSKMAAGKAAKWGHTNVWVYKGGIRQWRSAGMAVAKGN